MASASRTLFRVAARTRLGLLAAPLTALQRQARLGLGVSGHVKAVTRSYSLPAMPGAAPGNVVNPHQPPEVTFEMALAVSEATLANTENPMMMYQKALQNIRRDSGAPFHERWQAATAMFLTAQIHTLLHFGFTPDEKGLSKYSMEYERLARTHQHKDQLLDLQFRRWDAVTRRAFGVEVYPDNLLPLDKVRYYTSVLSQRQMGDEFLSIIDKDIKPLSTDQEKQAKLLSVITPLQQAVAKEFLNIEDEGDFVRLQISLMQYSHDDNVMYNVMAGTMAVFRRAGINLGNFSV